MIHHQFYWQILSDYRTSADFCMTPPILSSDKIRKYNLFKISRRKSAEKNCSSVIGLMCDACSYTLDRVPAHNSRVIQSILCTVCQALHRWWWQRQWWRWWWSTAAAAVNDCYCTWCGSVHRSCGKSVHGFTITTWMAQNFSNFGGIAHGLYDTSSPSLGTSSPSMLQHSTHNIYTWLDRVNTALLQ